ncbi:preprotein translocase, SecY subunit [Thermanaerovibrio velox DSM 12556]|uniref:Protein translocase subunit SecY n=1 Tax=Thermanaerovibrio velox DSM 12556 TaxID=926567 RepID=H0UQT0_9BACT|nr:preprotein translocase subunit SecY [Thermanaerovibrio velox]EHM09759.1 preprotein translocase, SecY subunit [Thermanaerovibrio velox DSM 12556]
MIDSFRDAFRLPDLKNRFLFVLAALFVYRLGAHIPTPGIDPEAMARLFERGGVLGFLDLFAGGALSRFSIFALGVVPYINSSIVMQLLTVVVPSLEKMQKEGEDGRKKITQYTRYGTVIFALVQSIGMVSWLRGLGVFYGGFLDGVLAVATVTTGSLAVMWLGEVMSDHGIGNGISMLIFAGIVARIPGAIAQTFTMVRMGEMNILVVLLALVIMVAVVAGCVMLQEGQRKLPVQYAKRVVGNRVYGGQSTYIPLRVNTAGVIPIIFASSVLLFPYTIARFFSGPVAEAVQRIFSPGSVVYMILYVALIVFFSFFYTAVVFNPAELAENMKKYGGFILGIRPGKPTADYIEKVMSRITLGGALALAAVAIVPTLMSGLLNVNTFYFGGTSVLIVVGVALDTVHQLEGQLLMRHYEGILKRRGGKSGGLLKL